MSSEEFFLLQNNVRVVVDSIHSHVSHIGLMISAGSRDESSDSVGAMHLIEHLLFKGTKTRSYFELMNYIESVGGDMNAYTSKEETCVYISIQNEYIERAVDVLSDIFYNSNFVQSEFEKERDVVIDEIHSYQDSPNEIIFDEFEEKLFEGHSLASNILGTQESLHAMNVEQLKRVYQENYITQKLTVSYVGGESVTSVLGIISKYFSPTTDSLSASALSRTKFVRTSPQFNLVEQRDTHQAHCMLGSVAPSMYSSSKTSMVLLNNLLGGFSFNAMLNVALREERGLTYNIESNYTAYSDTGIFSLYFGTDIAKVEACKDIVFDIFTSLSRNGLPLDRFEMYKQQLIGQVALSFDNHVSIMISNAKSYMNYDKVDSYEEVVQKISAVRMDEIVSLAHDVLNPDNLSVLLYK